jgi:hypothetical protein
MNYDDDGLAWRIYLILLPISASNNSAGHRMEGHRSNEVSSAEAVLVGALSSGVNVRTFLLMA